MEQAKFNYSPLEKALEKQRKTIEDQGEKEIKAIEEQGKQFAKSDAFDEKETIPFDKEEKVYHLISEKKYSISLLPKELKRWKH